MNKEDSFHKTSINWYPGHMAKTRKQINELMPLIDIVYELVDARVPYSSRIDDIDSIIKGKPRIIVMTKSDLCDINETNKWVSKYENEGNFVVLLNQNNEADFKNLINVTNKIANEINKKRIVKGLKEKEIRGLVIGIPNVGKSTFINRLAGKKVANVGNKPGVTKNLVWLKTKLNILLLDTPGILWPKFNEEEIALNLASFQAIKNEVLPLDDVAVHILYKLEKYYPDILKSRYDISRIDEDLCLTYDSIGKKIGALMSGGEIDYDRVSNAIINDVKNENISKITFDRYK